MKKYLVALCFIGMSGFSAFANASTITYAATGIGGDGAESASATITTGPNSLMVSLSSLIANPTGAGQEVSGIFITLSNTPTSDSLASSSGTLIDIAGGGAVTPGGSTITHWGTSHSGSTVCLETAGSCAVGGKPIDLIIGPGPYSNANSSITNRNPQIQDTGIFNLALNGITANTTVTGVIFEFGTSPDDSLTGHRVPPVPEPSSLLLLGTAMVGCGVMLRRRVTTAMGRS